MDTLRTFIRHIVGRVIRNKPDKMSSSFELRRLQVPGSKNQPLTDFYEYYWAHHMRDTKVRNLISWLSTLLFRKPVNVSKTLKPYYYIMWMLFLVAVIFFGQAIMSAVYGSYTTAISLMAMSATILFVDYNILRIAYGIIDDAARYLNPHPDNIAQRNKIREEGVRLLDTLHNSKKYSRIILVGHSLGTVIAYDLIRLYWSTLKAQKKYTLKKQVTLKEFTKKVDEIFGSIDLSFNAKVQKYQELQLQLWRELRECGWPWLITDFITMGSPLAHADMLLSKDRREFHSKQLEGEYPVSPPMREHEIYYKVNLKTEEGPRSVFRPTHLAPFICTQWTNIYFPHEYLVKGDLVGGPLQRLFGSGVKDIPVALIGFRGSFLCHTKYWQYESSKYGVDHMKHPTQAIINSLKLDCLRGKMNWPSP